MRHKVPIHLETPDKLLLNMTARQTLVIALGGTLAYIAVSSVWSNPLLLVAACTLATVMMVAAFLVAFIAPKKRSLDVWAFVMLTFLISPKCYTWRPLSSETRMSWISQAEEPDAEDDERKGDGV